MNNTEIKPQIEDNDFLEINKTAAELERVLNSENVAVESKEIIIGILDAESFEKGLTFNDPRIIRHSFPFLLDSIERSRVQPLLMAMTSALMAISEYRDKKTANSKAA